MNERADVLADLIHMTVPVEVSRSRLRALPWDTEEELIELQATDAVAALDRFLAGEITLSELSDWAAVIEGRDDIGLEETSERLLQGLLFDLATPEVAGPLSSEVAAEWRARLLRRS